LQHWGAWFVVIAFAYIVWDNLLIVVFYIRSGLTFYQKNQLILNVSDIYSTKIYPLNYEVRGEK
jgi:hypothetical protein